jgi:hypothetical protein
MTDAAAARGEQLDELNKATFGRHYRNIRDRGIADRLESALYTGPGGEEGSPLRRGLLEELRANAESVYGQAESKSRRAAAV